MSGGEYGVGYTVYSIHNFNNDTIALRSYGNLLILLVSRVGHSEQAFAKFFSILFGRLMTIYLSSLSCGGSADYVFFSFPLYVRVCVCCFGMP